MSSARRERRGFYDSPVTASQTPTVVIMAAGEGMRMRSSVPKVLHPVCGRPMVATDVPGCREVVRHGETGLLVPAQNPAALADAIACLAGNAELRHRLGARARAVAEAEFSEEIVVRDTLALYRQLLPGRLRQPASCGSS